MPEPRTTEWVSIPKAARALGVGVKVLNGAAARAELPVARPGTRKRYVRLEDARRWLASKTPPPRPAAAKLAAEIAEKIRAKSH